MASSSIEQSDKIPMFRGKIVEGEGGNAISITTGTIVK